MIDWRAPVGAVQCFSSTPMSETEVLVRTHIATQDDAPLNQLVDGARSWGSLDCTMDRVTGVAAGRVTLLEIVKARFGSAAHLMFLVSVINEMLACLPNH